MPELTKEFLYKRYVEEQKNTVDIGNEVGQRPAFIRAQLRRAGIPVRSRGEAIRLKKTCDVDSEELKRLYLTEGQSPRTIAEKLGTTRPRVLSQLRRMGIYEVSRTYQGEKHWHHGAVLSREHVNKILESRARNGSHTGPTPVPAKERFWGHVVKTETCWNWAQAVVGVSYGMLYDAQADRKILAHRLSWEIHYGSIPAGKNVLHKCDNPACVNPVHLFLGEHADNMSDMSDKGRARGGNAALIPEEIRYLRKAFATAEHSARELAQMFEVSCATVYNIISRRTCGAIQDDTENGALPTQHGNQGEVLSDDEVRFIRKARSLASYSVPELARLFGVTKVTVYKVVRRETYKSVPDEALSDA